MCNSLTQIRNKNSSVSDSHAQNIMVLSIWDNKTVQYFACLCITLSTQRCNMVKRKYSYNSSNIKRYSRHQCSFLGEIRKSAILPQIIIRTASCITKLSFLLIYQQKLISYFEVSSRYVSPNVVLNALQGRHVDKSPDSPRSAGHTIYSWCNKFKLPD